MCQPGLVPPPPTHASQGLGARLVSTQDFAILVPRPISSHAREGGKSTNKAESACVVRIHIVSSNNFL